MAFAEAWQRHSRHATGRAEPASVETGLTCMLPSSVPRVPAALTGDSLQAQSRRKGPAVLQEEVTRSLPGEKHVSQDQVVLSHPFMLRPLVRAQAPNCQNSTTPNHHLAADRQYQLIWGLTKYLQSQRAFV